MTERHKRPICRYLLIAMLLALLCGCAGEITDRKDAGMVQRVQHHTGGFMGSPLTTIETTRCAVSVHGLVSVPTGVELIVVREEGNWVTGTREWICWDASPYRYPIIGSVIDAL